MLFNTKKDRVIHHGTFAPTTSTIPEHVEEPSPKVLTPCPAIPPSVVSANPEVDAKLPDSSNDNDDIVGPTLQPEKIQSSEKLTPPHVDVSSESPGTEAVTGNSATEAIDVAESIQVDEISSSEIPEETAESENKGADEGTVAVVKSANLEDAKQPKSEERNETEARPENAQTSSQSNTRKSEPLNNKLKELLAETGASNATPQTAFPSSNEDVQSVTLAGSKLRRNGGVVSAEDNGHGETRNDLVLPRYKQPQQHPLFSATTPDVQSIKRRHSLNSQSRNAYADVAPSEPKTYASIKSRYKVPNVKSSLAGNATNEENNTLKNTSNRQTNGAAAAAAAGVGNKRRHSAIIAQAVDGGCGIQQQEPCAKRRTRSEDRPSLTDENDPANQVTEDANSRLSWPTSDSALSRNNGATATLSGQDRLSNTFQRRSLGKKATHVKTIRRPSISSSNRLQQLRGSFGLRDWDQGRNNRTGNCSDRRLSRTLLSPTDTTMPQRWLRFVVYGFLFLLSLYQTAC